MSALLPWHPRRSSRSPTRMRFAHGVHAEGVAVGSPNCRDTVLPAKPVAMTGMLTLDDLKAAADSGTIDTVVVAMTDMAGQLVGKRFHARYFVDSGAAETHACDYLLANDIDMEPVPGYAAASWERGYGDFVLKPDLSTLRRLPWLDGPALVLTDVLDHHHEPVPHSPRAILKRQLDR